MAATARSLPRITVRLAGQTDFDGWRTAARALAMKGVPADQVGWAVAGAPSSDLFAGSEAAGGGGETGQSAVGTTFTVTRAFVDLAETVICHRDPERFALLYRVLFRLREEPHLMKIASDPDVRRLEAMAKSVRRDVHKMRAFVRFRRIDSGAAAGGSERHVAWFEPEHFIVERNAPFFVRRFTGMRWTILTPLASADWDGERLAIGPGANKADAPAADDAEELWRTYFGSIFNPARLKVKAMQAEMPKKYWRNLPEASLIPDLIRNAEERAREMVERQPSSPAPHHARVQARHWPAMSANDASDEGADATTLDALREAAKGCRRCDLWRDATQTVFGEGPKDARVVFVGEQPGDREDIAGKPFVGPAGKVFDDILAESGIDRDVVYVTNAVKHFKFEPRGKRRIHARPNAGEVTACRWWLDRELALIRPRLVVALGATAAQSLFGRPVAITKQRGQSIEREDGLRVFLTIHPSFLLRIPDPAEKEAERARFLADMRAVKELMPA